MSGKGSGRRPQKVDANTFTANWERVFGKKARPITVTVPADLPAEDDYESRAGPLDEQQT